MWVCWSCGIVSIWETSHPRFKTWSRCSQILLHWIKVTAKSHLFQFTLLLNTNPYICTLIPNKLTRPTAALSICFGFKWRWMVLCALLSEDTVAGCWAPHSLHFVHATHMYAWHLVHNLNVDPGIILRWEISEKQKQVALVQAGTCHSWIRKH